MNLTSGELNTHEIAGIAASNLSRSLTYRVSDNSLYLLDLAVEDNQQWMRIVQIQRSGVARERLRLPFPYATDTPIHLSTAYNGMLLFSVSGSTEQSVPFYVMFDPDRDPTSLTLEGGLSTRTLEESCSLRKREVPWE